MPGVALASMCYGACRTAELTASMATTFTYPLLPTTGAVMDAYEIADPISVRCRKIQLEAFGPGLSGTPVRLMRLDAVTCRRHVARGSFSKRGGEFDELGDGQQDS
jgi:hypothetical protein